MPCMTKSTRSSRPVAHLSPPSPMTGRRLVQSSLRYSPVTRSETTSTTISLVMTISIYHLLTSSRPSTSSLKSLYYTGDSKNCPPMMSSIIIMRLSWSTLSLPWLTACRSTSLKRGSGTCPLAQSRAPSWWSTTSVPRLLCCCG